MARCPEPPPHGADLGGLHDRVVNVAVEVELQAARAAYFASTIGISAHCLHSSVVLGESRRNEDVRGEGSVGQRDVEQEVRSPPHAAP